jgi:mRNA-degrading endonuclease YafQ of YafQ-DinJ toxin-antitoxin module
VVADLQDDSFQPHLNLHPLGGMLEGCLAVILTYICRTTLMFLITEKEIVLLDIGSHGEMCL